MSKDQCAAEPQSASIQRYAKMAGVLFLLSIVGGGVGEFYIPSTLIVSSDAAATAKNILAHESLFRWGFAAYLLEATCDIALALILYLLLKPVDTSLALLAAFFRLVSTSVFGVGELFYFAALPLLSGSDYLQTFSPEQLNTLALFSLKLYGYCGEIFMVFYGVASLLFGYLMFRSRYLPRFLGALLALGGLGFVTHNLALVLAPRYAFSGLLLPMVISVLALTVWLLMKGIDIPAWEERLAK